MVTLLHEVWEEIDENGQSLPGCCLAGPDGDGHRALMSSGARLIHTFEAGSHYEAMTIYYRLTGWGDYTTTEPWDREPYPVEWLERQRGSGNV
jgi:hypothetical protein